MFYGSDSWRLHHQPRVQLGGPSGAECVPAARQPGSQPGARARPGGEDGMNDVCMFLVVVQELKGRVYKAVIADVMHCTIQNEL